MITSTKLLVYSMLLIWASNTEVNEATSTIPVRLYPEIETRVDRNEILIGDVFNLSITISHDPSVRIIDKGKDFDLGQFEIKDIIVGPEEKTPEGKVQRTDIYQLSTYFTGDFVIPAFDLKFQTADGQTGSIKTSPINIHVRSLTPEESENLDIRDIKSPVLLLGKSYLPYVLAIAAFILLVVVLAVWLWYRYKKKGIAVEVAPPLPPHVRAYNELQALRERRDLIEEKKYKEFAIRLSGIIRVYIQGRWGIIALDYTSEEIMDELNGYDIDESIVRSFERFFMDCDLMKFAKYETTWEAASQLIDLAEWLVDQTKDESMLSPILVEGIRIPVVPEIEDKREELAQKTEE